jgi:hypothetical protein
VMSFRHLRWESSSSPHDAPFHASQSRITEAPRLRGTAAPRHRGDFLRCLGVSVARCERDLEDLRRSRSLHNPKEND